MENKKGLSDVVTTVLIVLLTIVAIAILWSFLQPMFTSSGQKVQTQQTCLALSLEVTNCDSVADYSNVTVKRNPGVATLKELKLVFERPDGSTQVVTESTSTNLPLELETRLYGPPLTSLLFKAKSVTVAGGIDDGKGGVFYCNPTQPVACQ
jgi:FlaG/FlaF family flagellin (archaellin)